MKAKKIVIGVLLAVIGLPVLLVLVVVVSVAILDRTRSRRSGWSRRLNPWTRCGTKPVESGIAPDVTRIEYTRCAGDATVVLYTIQGGGHSWPGGKPLPQWWVGPTSRSIDATSQMWTFFREHQLLRK